MPELESGTGSGAGGAGDGSDLRRRGSKRRCSRVGVVVRQVLDVSAGTLLERDDDERSGGMELALVKEKLTVVHREFGAKATASWQEVA